MPRPLQRYENQDRLARMPIDNSRAETSAQLARLLQGVGDFTAGVGRQIAVDTAQERGTAAGGVEAPARRENLTAYGRAYNDAAMRAHAAAVDQDIRINLERIALEEDTDTARFDARVSGYRKGLIGSVDPRIRPAVEQEIELMTQRHRARVQAAEQKLILGEAMGTLVTAAEAIEADTLRAARDGDLDIVEHQRAKLIELLEGAAQTPENPDGLLSPAAIAARRAEFERAIDKELLVGDFERILREQGTAKAQEAMDAFEAGKIRGLEPLTPEDRDRLLARMNALLARQMTRENQDQAARDAAERARIQELNRRASDAIRVLQAGFMPEGLEDLVEESAGTEVESKVRVAAAIAATAQRFALSDPLSQEAAISALENDMRQGPVIPEQVELLNTLEKIHNSTLTALDRDALSFGMRQGLVQIEPLDFQDLPGSLRDRVPAAGVLEAHYGRPVSTMTRQEAAQFADALASGTAGERLALLNALHDGLGARAPSTLETLHKDGHETMAFVGGMISEGNPAARDVLLGLDHLAGDPGLKPKDLDVRPELQAVLQAYPPGAQGAARAAITAHYARLSAVDGDHSGEFNRKRWQTSVDAVTGGIVEFKAGRNRSAFPAPEPGMSDRQFRRWMGSLTPADIERMGGVAGLSPEFALEQIRSRGRLTPIARGRWLVSFTSPADGSERFLHAENPEPGSPEFVLVYE